ncbi:MAG: DinB family protein [Chloroflexota bacterium]
MTTTLHDNSIRRDSEPTTYAQYIERLVEDILSEIEPLSDDLLNQALPIQDTNTLYAIGTHTVGMGEFWVLSLVGEQVVARNRSVEFHASGNSAELCARFRQWVADCHALLDTMPDIIMNDFAHPPAEFSLTGGFEEGSMTKRECMLHVVEHTATHLGHIQLMRQLLVEGGLRL